MLDIKLLRQKTDWAKSELAKRGIKPEEIDELLGYDEQRRAALTKVEELKAERNRVSGAIAQMKRAHEDASEQITAMRNVGQEIGEQDKAVAELEEKANYILVRLPNIPDDSAPASLNEDDAREERKWGQIRDFGFTPKPHWEVGENLGILDFENAAKVSGSRFVYYRGAGARLERAVYNFFLDEHYKEGYTEVLPPYLVNDDSMFGTGQFPKFVGDSYTVTNEDSDLTLIPTAEVPLVNYYRDTVVDAEQLPINVTALSPAFRSEAGSAGRDTRGLIRMHQSIRSRWLK